MSQTLHNCESKEMFQRGLCYIVFAALSYSLCTAYLKATYYEKITFIRCMNAAEWLQCVTTTSL